MINNNKSLIKYFINSFNAFKVYRHCLSFNKDIAKIKTIFLINNLINIIFKVFIINLTYLFISF